MMLGQIIGVASMANFDVPLFRFLTIVGLGISSGCFATFWIYSKPILFVSKILPLFGMGTCRQQAMGKSFRVYF